jgi:hypothetical protein
VFRHAAQELAAKQKLRGKLKVYPGAEASARAQQPKPYSLVSTKVTA